MRGLAKLLLASAAALALAPAAHAQFPDKPLRVVVAWPPGSPTDSVARLVSERLSQRLGQPVTVENRPGANGTIGTTYVARAAPDGHTLVFATADTHSINPHVYKSLQYDAMKGFEPISLVGVVNFLLIARPNLEQADLQALVAAAKQNPGKISYGTWGTGSTAHVAFALLEQAAGIQMLHVPFQGSAPAMNAIMGSQVDIMVTGAPTTADTNRKAGKIKVLGISAPQRAPALPDVRTYAEQGVADAQAGSWYGFLAPAGIPPAVRDRLANEVIAIVKVPEMAQRITGFGWTVVGNTPAEFSAFMRAELDRYGKVIKSRGIQLDQP
jgi:tripartite-type tricarboxylate transporter receptor subunit TctC